MQLNFIQVTYSLVKLLHAIYFLYSIMLLHFNILYHRQIVFACLCFQVHYPMEALHNVPLSSSKAGLLEAQVFEIRYKFFRMQVMNSFLMNDLTSKLLLV